MREIQAATITQNVARLCEEANLYLGEDVLDAIKASLAEEESPMGKEVLSQIIENANIACTEGFPLCQDTGTTAVFLELGQDAHVVGGGLYDAINEGVRQGYKKGYLRKSIVDKPFSARKNTGDNTPAVIHTEVVPGDHLKIVVAPKGGGSENMTRLGMLTPSAGRQGVIDFVVRAVEEAGSNPCPPVVVCVGIGGNADKSLLIAKQAILRRVGERHQDPELAELELELLKRINATGIGPQGFGGRTTALDVHVETFPCHIASMPVAVNIVCHSYRHKEVEL
ncbi:MAG: fumarate hydratase [Dehalococcoidia bacterium]|nr:fumarate hydratase [Dehalococcoidia bacterium]